MISDTHDIWLIACSHLPLFIASSCARAFSAAWYGLSILPASNLICASRRHDTRMSRRTISRSESRVCVQLLLGRNFLIHPLSQRMSSANCRGISYEAFDFKQAVMRRKFSIEIYIPAHCLIVILLSRTIFGGLGPKLSMFVEYTTHTIRCVHMPPSTSHKGGDITLYSYSFKRIRK